MAFLLSLCGVASYTYLATMRMRMTSQMIASFTLIALTHLTGGVPTQSVRDIEMGVTKSYYY